MSASETPSPFDVSQIAIEDEMKRSYLDYAMSVIVSRALPDARDGLKPVHRRILYAMKESGYEYNKPFRKSARIVGDVMGKYHPHGDAAIYDTMVRMAQPFSMRLPLIDGQGNFGSMDGDRAAAMRYTEARLARSAHALLEDIDKETVDFQPNYDETVTEPVVLPARFPNLLVNGAGGIAVGMATNIPPHNLGEVIDGCLAYLANPAITVQELMENYVFGPDFPTGGLILGRSGIRSAFESGRGSVVMRGKTEIEDMGRDRQAIIITEIPYQVNKAGLVEKIADAVREKRIEGISDLRDESDRSGVRVVVEVKRDHQAEVVLNQLFKFTPLQTSFGVNMLALDRGRPEQMDLKRLIAAFVDFREEVITRRTVFELGKARDRAHILAGLAVAVANIDEVIALIRKATDPAVAREALMSRDWPAVDVAPLIALIDDPRHRVAEDGTYRMSEAQARAILDLRLHRLTGLERDKIGDDLKALCAQIEEYLEILRSRDKLLGILRDELLEMKEQFATPRRSVIEDAFDQDIDIEDLIQREDMVVTVTNTGYIKRVPLSAYRAQRRGGKGRSGMTTRDEDVVQEVFVASTHAPVLFFSTAGMVYKLKIYRLPLGTPQARGKAMVNLLPLKDGETISTVMPLPEDEAVWGDLYAVFATAGGNVRRNRLSDFANVMANGKIAMKFDGAEPWDCLVRVRTFADDDDVLLTTKGGKCIRFPVADLRVFNSRSSMGVRGIRLAEGDRVINMSGLRHRDIAMEDRDAYFRGLAARRRLSGDYDDPAKKAQDEEAAARLDEPRLTEMAANEEFLLTVTENGYGKRTSAYEYRITNRGGQGITNIDTGPRNGSVVASFPVVDLDQIVMVTDGGQLIRIRTDEIRVAGRNTQGVTLFSVGKDEHVVSVTRLRDVGQDEGESEGEDGDGEDAQPPAERED